MVDNPTTDGPVKSLRLVAPGGDIIPGIFAGFAALLLLGMLRNPPTGGISLLVDVVLVAAFAVPAYVLYTGARKSGLFVFDDTIEYRALGSVKQAWKREQVAEVMPISGGARVMAPGGVLLREYKYRFWNTEQVARFARAAGLAPPTALELAAEAGRAAPAMPASADVDPGKPGEP
ncbi:MAG: hypothetical protein NVSMB17_17630 [Candidatus Dormibacteria bacterium]